MGTNPRAAIKRLLSLEPTPEDREGIWRLIQKEPNWETDWAGAFTRAAHKWYNNEA